MYVVVGLILSKKKSIMKTYCLNKSQSLHRLFALASLHSHKGNQTMKKLACEGSIWEAIRGLLDEKKAIKAGGCTKTKEP